MEMTLTENYMKAICRNFIIPAEVNSVIRIGNGHIHDSFRVNTDGPSDYLLQRINHHIFSDLEGLMNNIRQITTHLEMKARQGLSSFPVNLKPIPTQDGSLFCRDEGGDCWRLFNYINGSRVYETMPSPAIARETGRAFGAFIMELADLDTQKLRVTLPRFHDFQFRFDNFLDSLSKTTAALAAEAAEEIEFIKSRSAEMTAYNSMVAGGEVPRRTTHNDTKLNNVLFDGEDKILCVIDLDTVMPGSLLHDFGDAIRTAANKAAEDEADLQKVSFDLEVFQSFTGGFLEMSGEVITPKEISALAFAPVFLTTMIGLRFLTDHLDGNVYYHVKYPGHNLVRARVQFRLAELMEEKLPEMRDIILNQYKYKNT